MWIYDFSQRGLNDEWNIQIPNMNHARVLCSAVALNNHSVMAIGGNGAPHRDRSVERYNIKTEKWTELASTNYKRSGYSFQGDLITLL